MKKLSILLLIAMSVSCTRQVEVTIPHPMDVEVEPAAEYDTLNVL